MTTTQDELGARIDELRREMEAATDEDGHRRLAQEIDTLHRAKVLRPGPAAGEGDWRPIPTLAYTWPTDGSDERFREGVRTFMRLFAGSIAASLDAGRPEHQFVSLLRIQPGPSELRFELTCPYAEPLDFFRRIQGDGRDEARAQLKARTSDLDVQHKYFVKEGDVVPVVTTWRPAEHQLAFFNLNHRDDPRQFTNPYLTRTTSGFLNFVGSLELGPDGVRAFTGLEPLMNQGLDQWFRWLYALVDTGVKLDPELLLVRSGNPEDYVYVYAGR